jgi:hypothetical protein
MRIDVRCQMSDVRRKLSDAGDLFTGIWHMTPDIFLILV